MEEMMKTNVNCKKEYWKLFFAFSMAAAEIDPNDKKISVLTVEVEPFTAINPKFC